ncbi:MAG: hypothetical protein H6581_09300 [Bacteroidia bacterium]|nr:hypothetical protein [Bacteroidia bacterium]
MKKIRFSILLLTLIGLLWGCKSNKAPEAAEVMEKLKGAYCAEGYRLELNEDTTFYNFRVRSGILEGKPLSEICRGDYSLKFDEAKKEWNLIFTKDKGRTKTPASCAGTVLVWSKKDGYVVGDSIVTLPELFDGVEVVKGNCDI